MGMVIEKVPERDRLIGATEVATILNISRDTLDKMVKEQKLVGIRGPWRGIRFSKKDVCQIQHGIVNRLEERGRAVYRRSPLVR